MPPKPARIINPASAPSVPGHRRRLRPQAAANLPRRVSGPAPGRAAAITLPRPALGGEVVLPRPGRGGVIKPRSRGATPTRTQPLPRRLIGFVRALPDHPLLDRVVRGRAWIAVLGVMLAGIVAMQVEVLKLGASIGRSLQRGSTLQSRNEQLRASVAELADDQRIERLAATMGMVMPAPDGVRFVSAGPGTVQRAIANIHPPNTQAFLALSSTDGAVAGASSATAGTASGAGTTPVTPAAGTTSSSPSTATGTPISATGAPVQTGAASQPSVPATGAASQPSVPATGAATQPSVPAPGAPTQTVTPASTGPAQTTSSASPGAGGAAALAPTQSSSPTGGTGGAGVPTAG